MIAAPLPQSGPVFLSAGEASGDHYGAAIVDELRRRRPDTRFFGLGGLEMERAGVDRIVRAEDVAVMGISEVIRHAPHIYREYRRLVAAIKARRPAVAVLIDFPDVNLRLALKCKQLGIPVLYFVSPQLWAWKRARLRWVKQRVDRMLVIFPFEEPFYRNRGVQAEFVGHPLAELKMPFESRDQYAERWGLDPAKTWVALLPGSREKEVRANLPEMLEASRLLASDLEIICARKPSAAARGSTPSIQGTGKRPDPPSIEAPTAEFEFLLPVASTLNRPLLAEKVGASQTKVTLVDDARAVLFHARASVVASGTATVQAALMGNPFIVVYRVSSLTYRIAKRLVRYPAEILAEHDERGNLPVGMVNLIAGRRVVPELLQERFTGAQVVAALRPLLADTAERERMIAGLAEVRERLRVTGGRGAIERVCDAIEEFAGNR